jgi:hypothetical protein
LLVVHNLSSIYAALYDVFNANYTRAGGSNNEKYCRIARAGFCNPRCAVVEHFKAALVVTPQRAAAYEPALLNQDRFAKIEIELEDLLQAGVADLKEAHGLWQQEASQLCPRLGAPNSRGANVAGEYALQGTDLVPSCPH